MKKQFLTAVSVMALLAGVTSCQKNGTMSVKSLKSDVDSVSYALGINVGDGFKHDLEKFPGKPVNKEALIAGFVEAMKAEDEDKLPMSVEDARNIMQEYVTKVRETQIKENREKEVAYLEENKSKEGVQVTPSGLHYKSITEGTGKQASDSSFVKVNYTGKLIDGTVFDSNIDRGEPVLFNVRGVIPGFSEGIRMMKEGGKAELSIPARLAYGDGEAGSIPPGSCIIFEVELVEVDPAMPARPGRPGFRPQR
ncbi:MAG: FKBP-type peptidyl-prolyl cis-trans isomerase [Paludibacteraceae bacterium]|nr:FKBP-type peptidyl-prolyl cis-trans isomerase [Paludibacteraceae bacterium]